MENLKLNQMENLGEVKLVRTQKVYSTKNYDLLKVNGLNRELTISNVKNLVIQIANNGLKNPIIVDTELTITDGHHRYQALKELGYNIEFVVDERVALTYVDRVKDMQSHNHSVSYTVKQLLEMNSKIDENYLRLKNMVDKYGFGINTTCDILYGKQTKLKDTYVQGKLRRRGTGFIELRMNITKDMIDSKKYDFEYLKNISEVHSNLLNGRVISLLVSLKNNQGLDFNQFLDKAQKNISKIESLYNTNTKFDFVEKLYNYKSKKPKYFIEPLKFSKINK